MQTLLHVAWQLLAMATVQLRPLLLLPPLLLLWSQAGTAHGPQGV